MMELTEFVGHVNTEGEEFSNILSVRYNGGNETVVLNEATLWDDNIAVEWDQEDELEPAQQAARNLSKLIEDLVKACERARRCSGLKVDIAPRGELFCPSCGSNLSTYHVSHVSGNRTYVKWCACEEASFDKLRHYEKVFGPVIDYIEERVNYAKAND